MRKFIWYARRLARLILYVISAFIVITAIGCIYLVKSSGDSSYKVPTSDQAIINDITQLNPIFVAKIAHPTKLDEIIFLVKNSTGPISIGGGKFSQGGQTAYQDSLHIDMRSYNKIVGFNPKNKEITVQPGITWRDIQQFIDPYNLSIRIMQTYSNFTVGGSLSVNVHGRYIGEGPLVKSVKSIKLVLADGTLVAASPEQNPELFYGAIGGYGGLGVIVEATLSLADNVKIERHITKMPIVNYSAHFKKYIRNNSNIIFHNADIYPPDFENIQDVSWYKSNKALTINDRLIGKDKSYLWQTTAESIVASGNLGKWIRQYIIDPMYYSGDRVVWRNWEASYDVKELEPNSRNEYTYVLREYFVPVEKFNKFVPKMREIFKRNNVNVLNVSIRHAHQDPGTLLAWAKSESFAFVVYYRQATDEDSQKKVAIWSHEMIDAALSVGGSYYLPYQLYESQKQFESAYPTAQKYFELKKSLDPEYKFRNKLWQHLYPAENQGLDRAAVNHYYRAEEQTYLTLPEWYLVFNPVEYADYLNSGLSPSDFPFLQSINQYWKLYDRSVKLVAGRYPKNTEYMTMLKVIGISTTIEYFWKNLYESTVGRISYWSSGKELTPEDFTIASAQTAYSKFIYEKAWYEFNFMPWVGKIWSENSLFGKSFIRKTERKVLLTAEFSIKALYAELIGFASKKAYEPSEGLIYVTGAFESNMTPSLPNDIHIVQQVDGKFLLGLPRWGEFTTQAKWLSEHGFVFSDISGNQKIVLSYIVRCNRTQAQTGALLLFSDPLVSNPQQKRVVIEAPVKHLNEILTFLNRDSSEVEHIYDY